MAHARNTAQGAYVVTEQGKLGVIGTKVSANNTVAISFRDLEKRTAYSENHPVSKLSLTVDTLELEPQRPVHPGMFVKMKTSKTDIYELLALFDNGKVLAVPLAQRLNKKFQAKSEHVVPSSNIDHAIALGTVLNMFIDRVSNNVNDDLSRLSVNLENTLACLQKEICNFAVKHRSINPTGKTDSSIYQLEDFQITNSRDLLQLLRLQALNYKIYTGLANADVLTAVDKTFPNALVKSVYPFQGLSAVPFKPGSPEDQFTQAYARIDIQSAKNLMASFFAMSGVREIHPEDLFGDSEACNASGCYKTSYYSDFVKPLYQLMVREMAQSQPYLSFLNWRLNKADFVQALLKTQKESQSARSFLNKLTGDDRYLFLSFSTSVEQELDKITPEQRTLILELFEQENAKKTLLGEALKEIKKPQFWGVLACYGVSTLSPIKFMHLACHAAGITVASHSLFVSAQQTRHLYGLSKLNVLKPEVYSNALLSLTIESALTLMYLRVALPDFNEPLRLLGKKTATQVSTNIGVQNMEKLIHNEKALNATKDQLLDIVQKMGASRLFSSGSVTASLLGSFISEDLFEDMTLQRDADLYQKNLLTVSEVYGRVYTHKMWVQMFQVSQQAQDAQNAFIKSNRELLDTTVDLLNTLYSEPVQN